MQMPFAPAAVLEEIARTASERARPVNEALPERTALRPDPTGRSVVDVGEKRIRRAATSALTFMTFS